LGTTRSRYRDALDSRTNGLVSELCVGIIKAAVN
jgi:hypothetical protein